MEKCLGNLLATFFQTQKNWKIKLLSQFHDIVGNDLKDHVSIIKVNDTNIIIGVSNSCLLQELRALAPLLLTKINQSLDIPRLVAIQFKLRGYTQALGVFMTSNHDEISSKDTLTLTQNDREALNKIQDKELVHVLETFRKRCYKEAQWKKK